MYACELILNMVDTNPLGIIILQLYIMNKILYKGSSGIKLSSVSNNPESKMILEHLSLIHTGFHKDLVSSLSDNFTETSFSDVTLVSDEQIPFQAHKFVLSACSPVMKDLLLNNPHSHPLIYLRGVKQHELLAILQFMYFGEASIFNNQINDFLHLANDFK